MIFNIKIFLDTLSLLMKRHDPNQKSKLYDLEPLLVVKTQKNHTNGEG